MPDDKPPACDCPSSGGRNHAFGCALVQWGYKQQAYEIAEYHMTKKPKPRPPKY